MEDRTKKWWKAEPFIFALFVLITSIPVISHPFFPTVDGPAHLHNGNLLKHYLFYNNSFLLDYFEFNKGLNSNFLDHFWFAVTGLFLPANLAEKSILIFYIISLPYAFRYLLRSINTNVCSASIASYLIFPFVYSFTFRIGFFNFCIGIPVVFWTLGYWIRNRESVTGTKMFKLMLLATTVYLSHVFNFMLLGIFLFTDEIQRIIKAGSIKNIHLKLKNAILVFVPGAILFIWFLVTNNNFEHAPPSFLPKERLLNMLLDINPVITLSVEKEILFTRILGIALVSLLTIMTISFLKKRDPELFQPKWMFSAFIVLVLFFVFPDWVVSGGFISIRWALFFFLTLIIMIGSFGLNPKQLALPVLLVMINHIVYINYHNEETKVLSDDAVALVSAEKHMEDNSVLLPLNYSANWIQINHACYLASERSIINLDNYEPTKPHFPLIWKSGEQVYDLMKLYGNRNPPCINIVNYENTTKHRIDYLSRFGFNGNTTDSCTQLVELEISRKFDLVYESSDKKVMLYKRKPNS
jgi:hypothetical protein